MLLWLIAWILLIACEFRAHSRTLFSHWPGKIENRLWAHRRARGTDRRPEWGEKRRPEFGTEPLGPGSVPRADFQSCSAIVKKTFCYTARNTELLRKIHVTQPLAARAAVRWRASNYQSVNFVLQAIAKQNLNTQKKCQLLSQIHNA